jgi:hypothetical protein
MLRNIIYNHIVKFDDIFLRITLWSCLNNLQKANKNYFSLIDKNNKI